MLVGAHCGALATLRVGGEAYARYMRTRGTAKHVITAPLRSSRRPSQAQISCCSSSMLVEKAFCYVYVRVDTVGLARARSK